MKAKSIERISVPDGKYEGIWGGYNVTIKYSESDKVKFGTDRSPSFKVDVGIRCAGAGCVVEVKEGYAYVVG